MSPLNAINLKPKETVWDQLHNIDTNSTSKILIKISEDNTVKLKQSQDYF